MGKFLDAINGVNAGSPPVFMMRQAGRYHAHYRKIKEKYTFEEICYTPKIAAEVALGPIETFDFDAGILFSDILFILKTIGYDVIFKPGPQISQGEKRQIDAMNFQSEAIQETKKLLGNVPLIGFVGGLATVHYFLEKSDNYKIEHRKLDDFIADIYEFYIANILLQASAGADCIAIFDSKTHNTSPQYWGIVQGIIDEIKTKTNLPVVYYSNTQSHLNLQGVNCFGLTAEFDIVKHLKVNNSKAFYGNFNQQLLVENPEICKKKIEDYLENILKSTTQEYRKHWVASLGHGVVKESFEENVAYFVKAVREIFA